MLIRDKVAEELKVAFEKAKESEVEIVKLETNEQFFQAIISKIKSELELLETTKSVENLAEIMELVDWIQISLGATNIYQIIENRSEKLGLYWNKYYIKDKDNQDK